MAGLLNRAQELRKRLTKHRQDQGRSHLIDDESGISVEEQEKIISHMEMMIASKRLKIDDNTFNFKPKRSSARLPLFINIIALIFAAGGAYGLFQLFNRQEASIVTDSASITTAEGKLIETLKRESEAQLSEKEQQIADIQNRLQEIDRERNALATDFNERISEREEQLREELEAVLEEERAKLTAEGLTEGEIEARLAALEMEKQQEYQQELQRLRTEAEADLAEKEAEIAAIESEYQNTLQEAQQERSALLDQIAEREAELQRQFEEEQSSIESERSAISAELERLEAQREQETLFLDQVNSYYSRINRLIDNGNFPDALTELDSFRAYLNEPAIRSFPAIQKRLNADELVIASLSSLLRTEIERTDPVEAAGTEAGLILDRLTALVEKGDRFYSENQPNEAKAAYEQALTSVPAIERGFTRLREFSENDRAARLRGIREIIQEGTEVYNNGAYADAMQIYREALTALEIEAELADRILTQAWQAGYTEAEAGAPAEGPGENNEEIEVLEAELADTEGRLQTLREELQELRNKQEQTTANIASFIDELNRYSDENDAPPDTGLLKLLETKITLRKVLTSESVKSQYPSLYEDTEDYFAAIENTKYSEGKTAALKDLTKIVQALENDMNKADNLQGVWNEYRGSTEKSSLLQFMNNLIAIYK